MEASITVLYTGNLRGDLALLPRMYSFIKQLRAHYSEEAVTLCEDDPAPANPIGKVLLLDLGDSCSPDVWHCEITGGRSTLVVLDGMGYDAANVSGFLANDAREKLGDMLRLALVDEAHEWMHEGIVVTSTPSENGENTIPASQNVKGAEDEVRLTVLLQPAAATHFEHNVLTLAPVEAGQIGVARLCTKKYPYELEEHTIFDLPRRTQPDPTIAGIVDFVISEAKYTQKRRQSQQGS